MDRDALSSCSLATIGHKAIRTMARPTTRWSLPKADTQSVCLTRISYMGFAHLLQGTYQAKEKDPSHPQEADGIVGECIPKRLDHGCMPQTQS